MNKEKSHNRTPEETPGPYACILAGCLIGPLRPILHLGQFTIAIHRTIFIIIATLKALPAL